MRSLKALLAVGVLLAGFAPALAADDSDDTNFKWNWYGSLRARPEYNDNLNDLTPEVDDEISYTNYRVEIGLYDPATGQRLPLVQAAERLGDAAILGVVEVR